MQRHYIFKEQSNSQAVFYRLVDLLLLQATLLLTAYAYGVPFSFQYLTVVLLAAIVYFFIAESSHLYRDWRPGYFKPIIFYSSLAWIGAVLVVLAYLFLSKTSELYSRVVLTAWFVLCPVALVSWRLTVRKVLRSLRRRGINTRSVAVIGATGSCDRLVLEIDSKPELGFRLIGIFDDRDSSRLDTVYEDRLVGSLEDCIFRARNNEFYAIFIVLPLTAAERIKDIITRLGDTTASVQVVPDLFFHSLMSASLKNVGQLQTISLYENPVTGASAMLKRAEDIVLSIVALLFFGFPMLIIALLIKTTSKGPVFFSQDRYGAGGRKIKVTKFRTMCVMENDNEIKQAVRNDPRVTRIGAFLRRTSLDELPQFFNVLKGDMSVIGPRPHAIAHNEEYRNQIDFYMVRHKIKPGITGWAQVNGWRGETDTLDKMQQRIAHDLDYIRNWSLWMDFKIVVFTIMYAFRDRNAY
ncbi:MAG: undecaprenyl-phosphate glucose phosphotransferase [Gammaproteobacteria bacterium]